MLCFLVQGTRKGGWDEVDVEVGRPGRALSGWEARGDTAVLREGSLCWFLNKVGAVGGRRPPGAVRESTGWGQIQEKAWNREEETSRSCESCGRSETSGSPVGAVPGQPHCSGRGRWPVRSSSVTPTPCDQATPGLPSVLRILRTGCPVQRTKRVPPAMSLFICPFVLSPECLPGARDTGTGAPAPQSGGDTEQQRARTA